jgi:hypothetical protein
MAHSDPSLPLVTNLAAELLIFSNLVKTRNQKYFGFPEGQISGIFSAVSRPQEGRIMIVTTRRTRDAVDALASGVFHAGRKRQSVRRSRVVLAPRPWRQAGRKFSRRPRWQERPLTGESTI